jgi:hypothetical protein
MTLKCINPQPLTDEVLSLVLDDFGDLETERHLAVCAECAARLLDMRRWDTFITTHVRRFQCPSPHRLGDYHAGMLNKDDIEFVRQHLEDCPFCQDELAILDEFLRLPLAAPLAEQIIPLWTSANVLKAQHVKTFGNLALKGLDGADDETAHDAKVGTASIFLESNVISTGWVLKGQILDSQVSWAGAVAEIRSGGATQQVCILDTHSEFRFELSTAGPLDLLIMAVSGVTLIVENVTIRP